MKSLGIRGEFKDLTSRLYETIPLPEKIKGMIRRNLDCLSYGAHNSLLVNLVDVPVMGLIDKAKAWDLMFSKWSVPLMNLTYKTRTWSFAPNRGLSWDLLSSIPPFYYYVVAFTALRLAPMIYFYRNKLGKSLRKIKIGRLKTWITYALTTPLQDILYFLARGMNPLNPYGHTDWCEDGKYILGHLHFPIEAYYGFFASLAGLYTAYLILGQSEFPRKFYSQHARKSRLVKKFRPYVPEHLEKFSKYMIKYLDLNYEG